MGYGEAKCVSIGCQKPRGDCANKDKLNLTGKAQGMVGLSDPSPGDLITSQLGLDTIEHDFGPWIRVQARRGRRQGRNLAVTSRQTLSGEKRDMCHNSEPYSQHVAYNKSVRSA